MREDPAAPVPTAPTLDDPGLRDDPASYEAQHDFELGAPVTAGALVGRYLVIRQVGAGAMGIVLSAFDPQLDRRVALKLLRPRGWSSSGSNDGLIDEAKALAKLSHPNVVGVHDVGVHEGRVFVTMEFVEGRTLGVRPELPGRDGGGDALRAGACARQQRVARLIPSGDLGTRLDFTVL